MAIAPVAVPTDRALAPSGESTPAPGFDAVLAGQLPDADGVRLSIGEMLEVLGGRAGRPPVASGAAPDGSSGGGGAEVLRAGERYLGVPYVWGGTDAATGFDCSGFVQQVYADMGVELPRVSREQAQAGVPVATLDAAAPGDLVYWDGDGGRPNHIGIYAGDDTMLVAPSSGDVVRYQEITRPPDAIRRVAA